MDHKAHHVLLSVVGACFDVLYVGSLFRLSVFLGMSTYMLRCALVLEQLLLTPGTVIVVSGPIPSHNRIYAEQLIDFMVSTASGTTRSLAMFRSRLGVLFFELWNCGFQRKHVVHHACSGEHCKCGGSRDRLLALLLVAMRGIMYSRVMPRAALGKWLQLTNALRWLVLAQVCSFFGLLFGTAVKGLKFKTPDDSREELVAAGLLLVVLRLLLVTSNYCYY